MSKKQWWRVTTDGSERGSSPRNLGTYYEHLDDIAFALADKQEGWWCDGKLTFHEVKRPGPPKLPKKRATEVNVCIEPDVGNDRALVRRLRKILAGRPVEIVECSQFYAATLRRKDG